MGIADLDVDELIGGIPVVRLEHLAAYQQIAWRDKDVEHLEPLHNTRPGVPD